MPTPSSLHKTLPATLEWPDVLKTWDQVHIHLLGVPASDLPDVIMLADYFEPGCTREEFLSALPEAMTDFSGAQDFPFPPDYELAISALLA